MQWLQDLNQSKADNLNNVRREVSRPIRKIKKEYLKAEIEELETNSKIKNIRDSYRGSKDCRKGYQPRTNTVRDEMGGLVTDYHIILARWRSHFSQLFSVLLG
jgi:hypothetical protein